MGKIRFLKMSNCLRNSICEFTKKEMRVGIDKHILENLISKYSRIKRSNIGDPESICCIVRGWYIFEFKEKLYSTSDLSFQSFSISTQSFFDL
jgi:hypothetical protein